MLAVATVFIGSWILLSTFDSQRRGHIRKTKPMQELEPKVKGGNETTMVRVIMFNSQVQCMLVRKYCLYTCIYIGKH